MRALIDHVVSFGHQRIGFVAGQPGLATTRERIEAFRAALAANGLEVCRRLYLAGERQHRERRGIHARDPCRCASPPTALVTGNNMTTIGAMRAIRERGLVVPRDLSLVGFDDFEWADCFEPRLTLVAQPCNEIGRQAAALLSERIAFRRSARRRTVRLEADACACANPARGRHERRRCLSMTGRGQALRRRPGAARRRFRPASRRDPRAARRERRRQVDADEPACPASMRPTKARSRSTARRCALPIRAKRRRPASPRSSRNSTSCPSLDVAANLFLGRELMRPGGFLDVGGDARARRASGWRRSSWPSIPPGWSAISRSASGRWWPSSRRCPTRRAC